MEFISDPNLYKAVMFARRMIGKGTPPPLAISKAARYHGYATGAVAHYVGQAAARIKNRRPRQ